MKQKRQQTQKYVRNETEKKRKLTNQIGTLKPSFWREEF
jgi:hypothetical protein